MPFARSARPRQRVLGPSDSRAPRRRTTFGVSPAGKDEILRRQGNRCPGCGAPSPAALDHDHACPVCGGRGCPRCVRGFLCSQDNLVLGLVRDDPARLRRLADYLERPR